MLSALGGAVVHPEGARLPLFREGLMYAGSRPAPGGRAAACGGFRSEGSEMQSAALPARPPSSRTMEYRVQRQRAHLCGCKEWIGTASQWCGGYFGRSVGKIFRFFQMYLWEYGCLDVDTVLPIFGCAFMYNDGYEYMDKAARELFPTAE